VCECCLTNACPGSCGVSFRGTMFSHDADTLRPMMSTVRDLLTVLEPGRLYRVGLT